MDGENQFGIADLGRLRYDGDTLRSQVKAGCEPCVAKLEHKHDDFLESFASYGPEDLYLILHT